MMKTLALFGIAANFCIAVTDGNISSSAGWLAAGLFASATYLAEREVSRKR